MSSKNLQNCDFSLIHKNNYSNNSLPYLHIPISRKFFPIEKIWDKILRRNLFFGIDSHRYIYYWDISCRKSFCQIRLYKDQCVLHKVKLQSLRNQLRFWIPNDVKINRASGLIDNHVFHWSAVVYYKMLIYHSKLCIIKLISK